MDKVFLVWECGGDYDSRYDNVILAYNSQDEADRAVAAIEQEMVKLKELGYWTDAIRNWDARGPGESITQYQDRARREWDEKVLEICKVYPVKYVRDDGSFQINIPDLNDNVTFNAAEMNISALP